MIQDYEKHGVHEVQDKQALFRLIQSLGSAADDRRCGSPRVFLPLSCQRSVTSVPRLSWHAPVRVCCRDRGVIRLPPSPEAAPGTSLGSDPFVPALRAHPALTETTLVDLDADDSDFLTEVGSGGRVDAVGSGCKHRRLRPAVRSGSFGPKPCPVLR